MAEERRPVLGEAQEEPGGPGWAHGLWTLCGEGGKRWPSGGTRPRTCVIEPGQLAGGGDTGLGLDDGGTLDVPGASSLRGGGGRTVPPAPGRPFKA